MPDAIIFDVDGTLLDSVDYHAKAWVEVFRRHGIDVTFDAVRSQIGKGGDQLLPVFVPKPMLDAMSERLTEERRRHFKETYLPRVRPFPKVRDLFERLTRDGKRCVLASSGTEEEVEEYKRIAGVADLLDSHTSSDDAERSKPHPDIFLAALQKLGDVDRARVLVVGDTPYDARAAGKAGLAVIGVLCGGFPANDLRAAGCRELFRDPEDLLRQYDRWARG